VSPVFADDSPEFDACQNMPWKDGKKAKMNCFKNLAGDLVREFALMKGQDYKTLSEHPSHFDFGRQRVFHPTKFKRFDEVCERLVQLKVNLRAIQAEGMCAGGYEIIIYLRGTAQMQQIHKSVQC
jgi:hypothetical protein